MKDATALMAVMPQGRPGRGFGSGNFATNLQLYISTGEPSYLDQFEQQLWPALDRNVSYTILTALHAIPHMDASYKENLRPYVIQYKEYI